MQHPGTKKIDIMMSQKRVLHVYVCNIKICCSNVSRTLEVHSGATIERKVVLRIISAMRQHIRCAVSEQLPIIQCNSPDMLVWSFSTQKRCTMQYVRCNQLHWLCSSTTRKRHRHESPPIAALHAMCSCFKIAWYPLLPTHQCSACLKVHLSIAYCFWLL